MITEKSRRLSALESPSEVHLDSRVEVTRADVIDATAFTRAGQSQGRDLVGDVVAAHVGVPLVVDVVSNAQDLVLHTRVEATIRIVRVLRRTARQSVGVFKVEQHLLTDVTELITDCDWTVLEVQVEVAGRRGSRRNNARAALPFLARECAGRTVNRR